MFRHVEELAVEIGVEVHRCQRVLLTRSEMTTSGLVLALERQWNTYRQLNDERKSHAGSLGGPSYSPGHGQYAVDPCQRVLLTHSEVMTSSLVLALERQWNTYRQLNDERKSHACSLGGPSYSPGHGQYKVDPCLGPSPRLTPVREQVWSRSLREPDWDGSLPGSQSEVDPCQRASPRLIPVWEPVRGWSLSGSQTEVDPCQGASPRLIPVWEPVRGWSLSGSQTEVDPCQGASPSLIPVREPDWGWSLSGSQSEVDPCQGVSPRLIPSLPRLPVWALIRSWPVGRGMTTQGRLHSKWLWWTILFICGYVWTSSLSWEESALCERLD